MARKVYVLEELLQKETLSTDEAAFIARTSVPQIREWMITAGLPHRWSKGGGKISIPRRAFMDWWNEFDGARGLATASL